MIDFDDKRPEATARRSFKSLTATARTFLARRPGVVCVFLSSAHGLAVQKRIEMPLGAHTHTHVLAQRTTCYGPITIAIRARFEYDTTSYEELCAFEQ